MSAITFAYVPVAEPNRQIERQLGDLETLQLPVAAMLRDQGLIAQVVSPS